MTGTRARGTKFRLFPEYAQGYRQPELVTVALPPGSIAAGPADEQFYVANAIDKAREYEPPGYMPPYRGAEFAPARPDRAGEFDRIGLDTPQFLAAHLYGVARHSLDVWQTYLGHQVTWWHAPAIPRLELVPFVAWQNAHSGPGYLETGYMADEKGAPHRLALNLDIVAHEVGHAVLFAEVGVPSAFPHAAFLAFHESFADLMAMVVALNFESVIDRLFWQTDCNIYVPNLVNRLGELSDNTQLRMVSSRATMTDVMGLTMRPDGHWVDPLGRDRNQHQLGEPLSGAIFDAMVELYQEGLAQRGLIPAKLDPRGWTEDDLLANAALVARAHGRALRRFETGFRAALIAARDTLAVALAHVMHTVHPETLTFERVAARFLEALVGLGRGALLPALCAQFRAHGIDPMPLLSWQPAAGRGAATLRVVDDEAERALPRTTDPAAYLRARRLMLHAHREGGEAVPQAVGAATV